jgi:hypothetical protein
MEQDWKCKYNRSVVSCAFLVQIRIIRKNAKLTNRVVDPYSFFTDPDPDPVDPDGGQYGSGYGSGSGSNPDPGL